MDFTANRTSGTKQLSLGFLKPCIIERSVAEYYGFTDRNAIIYDDGNLTMAVERAICMSEEEYQDMVSELEKLCTEIRDRSEKNLQSMICKLNAG